MTRTSPSSAARPGNRRAPGAGYQKQPLVRRCACSGGGCGLNSGDLLRCEEFFRRMISALPSTCLRCMNTKIPKQMLPRMDHGLGGMHPGWQRPARVSTSVHRASVRKPAGDERQCLPCTKAPTSPSRRRPGQNKAGCRTPG